MDVVWKEDGRAVQGLGNRKTIRNGHRFVALGNAGGKRPRIAKVRTPPWLHPDAQPAKRARIERSVQRHRG